jgi:hypothetical protein
VNRDDPADDLRTAAGCLVVYLLTSCALRSSLRHHLAQMPSRPASGGLEIAESHPGADLQRLRVLRRNAIKEHEAGKPPRSYREIFRVLREIDESTPTDEQAEDENEG